MSMVMDKDNLKNVSLTAKEVMATWCLHPFITDLVGHIPDLVEEVLRLRVRNAELFGHLTNVNTTNDALTKRAICLSEQLELAENRVGEAYKDLDKQKTISAGQIAGTSLQNEYKCFVLQENIKGLQGHIYALDERRAELTKQLAETKEASDTRVQPLVAKIQELKKELKAAKTFKIDGRVDHFSQLNDLIGLGLEATKNSLKNAFAPEDTELAIENIRKISREVEAWDEIVKKRSDCNRTHICPNCGAEFIDDKEEDGECT